MKHVLVLGIEHLMTGIQLVGKDHCHGFQFVRESPSTVRVESDEPFYANWPNRCIMDSAPIEESFKGHFHGDGEIEWYAQVVAPAMVKADQSSYEMQNYTRRGKEYAGVIGGMNEREPVGFPPAVVNAMRRKHGATANTYLAMLRWNRDHWFYNHYRMYIGVEPDGHIHT
jgi:hypothetical protein